MAPVGRIKEDVMFRRVGQMTAPVGGAKLLSTNALLFILQLFLCPSVI